MMRHRQALMEGLHHNEPVQTGKPIVPSAHQTSYHISCSMPISHPYTAIDLRGVPQ